MKVKQLITMLLNMPMNANVYHEVERIEEDHHRIRGVNDIQLCVSEDSEDKGKCVIITFGKELKSKD